MNHEFVIDGTDIICNINQERLLAPLLQLLISLHERGHVFYCYFDADTRYKFERDLDKQLYQSIIKFGLTNYFNQISGGDADKLILKQATDINAKVVSTDNYRAYYDDYQWLLDEKSTRLIRPDVIADTFIVDKLDIKTPLNNDVTALAKELINRLEAERENLEGTIDKYKKERQFGFIKRRLGDKKLFFHKRKVTDKKLDYTILGSPVTFALDIDKSGGIYYFCAVDIKQKTAENKELVLNRLSKKNKELAVSKEFLQKQSLDLREAFEKQIDDLVRKNDNLLLENQELKKELNLHTSSKSTQVEKVKAERDHALAEVDHLGKEISQLNEIIQHKDQEIEDLKKEIEALLAQKKAALEALEEKQEESNELAIALDFQEEKIQSLDNDLRSAIKLMQIQKLGENEMTMYQQLKQDYEVLLGSLQQKNNQISFLTNNLSDLQQQVETLGTKPEQSIDIEDLVAKVNELEQVNLQLSEQLEKIEKGQPAPKQESESNQSHFMAMNSIIQLSKEATTRKRKPPKNPEKEATLQELEIWWYNLEDQWKIAFNQAILQKGETTFTPDEANLRSLFNRKKFDIVGSGILLFGLNQLSFKLTNLSGLKELTQIVELNLSGHDLTNLKGIEHFKQLEFLNCTSNKIRNFNELKYLTSLKTLIIQDNELQSLRHIEALNQLEYINCLYNHSIKSIGKVKLIDALQTICVENYKTIIRLELEDLKELRPALEIRNV